jgi:hypothetical protein
MARAARDAGRLRNNATVAIVGGGPAGSFLAIHLLRLARERRRNLRVVIFERRRPSPDPEPSNLAGPYKGCPRCAGGISPRLNDALAELKIELPDDVLQSRVSLITVQGNWKPIYLKVPRDRQMLSVYRGSLPLGHGPRHASFDALLMDTAVGLGAELIGSRVSRVFYDGQHYPVLCYAAGGADKTLKADFAAFAGGVNERSIESAGRPSSAGLFRMLQPAYEPPRLRKALIAELAGPTDCFELAQGTLHYVESSAAGLQLDMCSIMPKTGYFTISLIGGSVDNAASHKDNLAIIQRFLATPRIRRVLPMEAPPQLRCICNPYIVVGMAKQPFGQRAAAVGDMATSRQYKDGILAAHDMARDLAAVIVDEGTGLASLAKGYGPTLARFRRDNRFASVIFFLYRWFFTSPLLSRIIYQTFASERKSQRRSRRGFAKIFWGISSGDEQYEQIARAMLRPATLWKIFKGGAYITLRNGLTELFFGLDWTGVGRFPTAVPAEQLPARRRQLLQGRRYEFECLYTIHIRASLAKARRLLAEFGEPSRPYLDPRWVSIRRTRGTPLQPGCTIRYRIVGGIFSFEVVQEESGDPNVIRYRVLGGFADGGLFVFLLEPEAASHCALTIYLAFDYARGSSPTGRLLFGAFRLLFPEFIHDVLWNHALCEFKQSAECRQETGSEPRPGQERQTLR